MRARSSCRASLTHVFAIRLAGFETWHIDLFVAGLVGGNYALLATGLMGRPTPGALPLDAILQPSNPTFKLFLLTTALLFAKTHLVMWAQVWLGCKHNRCAMALEATATLALSHIQSLSRFSSQLLAKPMGQEHGQP